MTAKELTTALPEQFGAIPVRAFGDTRLSGADFRVMGAIAYFDRFGRNGTGCYVDARRLAELAAIDYSHVARHTQRLQTLDYLKVERSAKDRRKRVYSLIYNEDQAVVANSGENMTTKDEKVANGGDKQPEKVANPNLQVTDVQAESAPKISCETELKDLAKLRARAARFASPDGYASDTTQKKRSGSAMKKERLESVLYYRRQELGSSGRMRFTGDVLSDRDRRAADEWLREHGEIGAQQGTGNGLDAAP